MDNYLQIKFSRVYHPVVDSSQRALSFLSQFYCVHAAKTKLLKSHICGEPTKLYVLCSFKIMNHYHQIKFSMFYYPVVEFSQRVLSFLSHFYCVHAAKTKFLKSHICEESTKLYILCSFEMDYFLPFNFPKGLLFSGRFFTTYLVTIVPILLRFHIQQKII